MAIVAGAAWGGIGAASALVFAREGAKVVVSTRSRKEKLDETVEKIRAGGGEAVAVMGDVAEQAHWDACLQAALDHFGKLDVLMDNAGGGIAAKPVIEFSPEEWRKGLDMNLTGAWLGAKTCIPEMIRNGGGSMVFISTVNSFVTSAGFGVYSASKAGMNALARSIALEYGREGIRCNAIAPGFVAGERHRERLKETPLDEEMHRDCYPIGRFGAPEEIAHAALFLASDEASFITGITLVADGGFTLQTPEALVVPGFRRRWRDDILVPQKPDEGPTQP